MSASTKPSCSEDDFEGVQYFPPEFLLSGTYNQKADLRSVGIVMFTILVGKYPFYHKSQTRTIQLICLGFYTIPSFVSELGRSMISSLLTHNINDRVNAWALLEHPWFKEYGVKTN